MPELLQLGQLNVPWRCGQSISFNSCPVHAMSLMLTGSGLPGNGINSAPIHTELIRSISLKLLVLFFHCDTLCHDIV